MVNQSFRADIDRDFINGSLLTPQNRADLSKPALVTELRNRRIFVKRNFTLFLSNSIHQHKFTHTKIEALFLQLCFSLICSSRMMGKFLRTSLKYHSKYTVCGSKKGGCSWTLNYPRKTNFLIQNLSCHIGFPSSFTKKTCYNEPISFWWTRFRLHNYRSKNFYQWIPWT